MPDQPVRLFAHTDIDIPAAQALLRQYDGKAVIDDLRRIPEGSSTSNYAVGLRSGRKLLLKLYPEDGGRGAREMAAYRYAAKVAKVPEVYWYDGSRSVFHRPYAVIEFIEGAGLSHYVMETRGLPVEMARRIGERLALLHGREYGRMALLGESLEEERELLPVSALHAHYLNGKPGSLISPGVRGDVLGFLAEHTEMLDELEARAVFSHGDFSFGNMIVDGAGEVWFIDFEYALAAPPYQDIGRFFRDKTGVSQWLDRLAFNGFICGYNACTAHPLGEDWYGLSRLMDMTSLLHLLNYDSAACWAGDIEEEIGHTLRVLRQV